MISEVSNNVLGPTGPQSKGGSGSVSRVQGEQPVVAPGSVSSVKEDVVQSADRTAKTSADEAKLDKVVEDLNEFVQVIQRKLQFSVDEESGKTVVKVIDSETDQIIRQIPSEEILEMQNRLGEMNGLLFQTRA